jgi:hypothetical protein
MQAFVQIRKVRLWRRGVILAVEWFIRRGLVLDD